MNILGMNIDFSDNKKMNQQFHRFAGQLSDWYCHGKAPELASQDTRFVLELQKQKLQSLGLDVQMQVRKSASRDPAPFAASYSDNVFVNAGVSGNKLITTTIRDSQKEIYSKTAESVICAIMQYPKEGSVPSPDTGLCCPHCGAPSTLGKLESGCEFCGTKFLMDELYPKVMHYSVTESGETGIDTKQILKYSAAATVIVAIICLIAQWGKDYHIRATDIIGPPVAGLILGVTAWFVSKIAGGFIQIGKGFRGAGRTASSLRFCQKMRELDPAFSTEYFRDKSLSLLMLMLYSPNPQELTVCACEQPVPEELCEIVNATYCNSGVNKYSIKDGVCDVTLTFYLDSVHYCGGRIRKKSDKIRMSLRKVITKPTDLGFSVTAVTCPSCGASFDAEKVKACPFCGNTYPLEENDWIVTDLRLG